MSVKYYIRENWKVKFVQIKDISPVAIESITRFHPDLGKAFKIGQTQHQKNLIVFNLKSNKSSSIFKKMTDPFQFITKIVEHLEDFQ